MDLRVYGRVLWKRAWIVILLAAIGGLGAIGFSKIQQPIYRSIITLSAVPTRPSDYGQTLAIKNLVRQYSRQLQTKAMGQRVVDQLQLDIPVEKFLSEINVSSHEDDLTLDVEVKDPNEKQVSVMVQTLAETFVIQHEQENLKIDQQDRILVNILENASPAELFSPKTRINALAGAILGGLVGLLMVFVLEYLQSSFVRSSEDVERYLGMTVLGLIPAMSEKTTSAAGRAPARRWFWQKA